jgi:hypothetical protein
MKKQANHGLKIADTPSDGPSPSPKRVAKSASTRPARREPLIVSRPKGEHRGRCSVERVYDEEAMDAEIDRVNRTNGVGGWLAIAEGTSPDDGADDSAR